MSEDEARRAMLSLSLTVTENICYQLAESLRQLGLELAKAKAARQYDTAPVRGRLPETRSVAAT